MTPRAASPPRRLLHRLPVRVRHYWKLLVVCTAFVAVCALVFSTVRVTPMVTSASDADGDQVTENIAGTTDLFDATKAHRITLTFRDDDYQRLLDEYWDEGEKGFLEADLTIDGTGIPSVGIRLKGNSTLGGLTRNGQARPGGFGAGRGRVGGLPGGGFPAGGFPGGGPPGGFVRASLKAEEPETLPWLIRLDEFVDGRRYQGHRDIAVRVAGMGGGTTVLNEAVSLNVLATAGQTVQRFAYSSFAVNDRPTVARLIVEHPDDDFADTLGGSGVLYKSLATGQFTDQGDDPTAYADDFKQITKKGSQDIQPVIDLVKWVNTSSDSDFDKHLDDHVDVQAFARYVAIQNLLLNFDDMAGPGHNYYLWYDLKTELFTVVGWDYNLAFSGSATQGPHDNATRGGGRFPGNGGAPQPDLQQPDLQPPDLQPPDLQPPDFQPPNGVQPPGGNAVGGPGGRGGHKLKERFLASAAFTTVYEDAYRELYREIYAGADALNILDRLTEVLATVGGNNADKSTADAEQLRTLIRERTRYLATDDVITAG